MNFSKLANLVLVVVLCAVVGVLVRGSSDAETVAVQDVSSLDRRLSLLEQRFYSVESSISRLQTYVANQRPPVSQSGTNDREINLLREEVQRLSLRLGDVECGLLKLDERTTSGRKSPPAKPSDPCRINSDAPVRLPTRP
jgi:hypothetical protein